MAMAVIALEIERDVGWLRLDRPDKANAYDEALLAELEAGLERCAATPGLRAVVIASTGRHFQAGADIDWLAAAASAPPEAAYRASMATTRAMQRLMGFPLPTIARVDGACFGGGVGLVAACDIALASSRAQFALTEIRLGVAPTPIVTVLAQAIGLRAARRYALTGERFDAEEARRIGLVHEVVAAEALEARLEALLAAIRAGAPGAIALTKRALLAANGALLDEREMALLAHESWMQRSSAEGREGIAAFRARRPPPWLGETPDGGSFPVSLESRSHETSPPDPPAPPRHRPHG
jgi:methylglutaconyl-CoA hydratase